MNLEYGEILKLKGTWLYDEFTGGIGTKLRKVTSSTHNNVVLNNGITTKTHIFLDTRQKNFRLATNEEVTELMEQRYFDFLDDNYGIIRAMAHSNKYKGWGGNAYSMAEGDILKDYTKGNSIIDFDYVDIDKIVEEYKENI